MTDYESLLLKERLDKIEKELHITQNVVTKDIKAITETLENLHTFADRELTQTGECLIDFRERIEKLESWIEERSVVITAEIEKRENMDLRVKELEIWMQATVNSKQEEWRVRKELLDRVAALEEKTRYFRMEDINDTFYHMSEMIINKNKDIWSHLNEDTNLTKVKKSDNENAKITEPESIEIMKQIDQILYRNAIGTRYIDDYKDTEALITKLIEQEKTKLKTYIATKLRECFKVCDQIYGYQLEKFIHDELEEKKELTKND